MVNNLVFRWPKPLFCMVLGAHGRVFPKRGSFEKKNGENIFSFFLFGLKDSYMEICRLT